VNRRIASVLPAVPLAVAIFGTCFPTAAADNATVLASARPDPYVRPYGDRAPWNIPAAELPSAADTDRLVALLWNEGTAHRPGNFNLSFDGYTYPVYYVGGATGLYPLDIAWKTALAGAAMPWNPDWVPASGSDAQVIVLDPATGREWNLWQVSFESGRIRATNGNLVPGSYWTNTAGFHPSRGAGIPYYAMLVQPEEIEQGAICHALSMPIKNTDGERFVPPATKLEHPGRPRGIPEGTRFVVELTEADIDSWIRALPSKLSAETTRSARIIAKALRTYGFIVTDTSGGAHLQFEDYASAGAKWRQLGLHRQEIEGKEFPRDLLDGLFDQDAIRAVVSSDRYAATSAWLADCSREPAP
jgi:hypothetical protein